MNQVPVKRDEVDATVIIPLRNGATTLADQLAALATQDYPGVWELIVSDNGSTDDGPELVHGWIHSSASARVIDSSAVPGVSFARNAAAREARGRILLFCDSDDVVDPNWLSAMMRACESFDLVGGRLEVSSLNRPEMVQARPNPQSTVLPMGGGHLRYAVGANFAMRQEVFQQVNGWDMKFVAGCDDVDFCWRAQYLAYTIGFAPEATIHYRYRSRGRDLWKQYYRFGKMEPLLYREHRSQGMRRRTGRRIVRAWLWFLKPSGQGSTGGARTTAPLRSSRAARLTWISELAYLLGRVCGSIRYHVMYL